MHLLPYDSLITAMMKYELLSLFIILLSASGRNLFWFYARILYCYSLWSTFGVDHPLYNICEPLQMLIGYSGWGLMSVRTKT